MIIKVIDFISAFTVLMKKLILFPVITIGLLALCCNYRQHPEKNSDSALNAVLAYNKQLKPKQGYDDQDYITRHGDSTAQAFFKQVEKTPRVGRKAEVGVRYKSRKNKWSYYITRETRDVYSVIFFDRNGVNTLLCYRVNAASGVVESVQLQQ
jgi:hypothetical protein